MHEYSSLKNQEYYYLISSKFFLLKKSSRQVEEWAKGGKCGAKKVEKRAFGKRIEGKEGWLFEYRVRAWKVNLMPVFLPVFSNVHYSTARLHREESEDGRRGRENPVIP